MTNYFYGLDTFWEKYKSDEQFAKRINTALLNRELTAIFKEFNINRDSFLELFTTVTSVKTVSTPLELTEITNILNSQSDTDQTEYKIIDGNICSVKRIIEKHLELNTKNILANKHILDFLASAVDS